MVRYLNKLKMMLVCILVLSFMLPANVLGASSFDSNKDISFSINYVKGSVNLSGAKFRIYKVASADGHSWKMTDDFVKYPIDTYDLDQDGWLKLADTMIGYVNKDKIVPLDRGVTDSHGNLKFPTSKEVVMKPGLYLVSGDAVTVGSDVYVTKPFFVVLPMPSNGKGKADEYEYDVSVVPKNERSRIRTTVSKSVRKVWIDDGYKSNRPSEIVVFLFKNGVIYEAVKLNSSNNWYYKWNDLDAGSVWSVAEKEVPGYTVNVVSQDNDFVVTNTYKNNGKEKKKSDNGEGVSSTTPDDVAIEKKGGKIPQTGLLWWPVWVLSSMGIIFVTVGLIRRGKSGDEKE